jgi:hypothetical protein
MHANDESAASGQPIPTGKRGRRDRLRRDRLRCELVPVPSSKYVGSFRRKLKPPLPALVLDMDTNDAIRVIDANTNELIASDWLGRVTAAPANYTYVDENNPSYTQPLLIVDVPGFQPLRIGARSMGSGWGGPQFRYGWRGSFPTSNLIFFFVVWLLRINKVRSAKEPAYVVTEAEWLTLVEKFGLGTCVVDEHASGKIERRNRRKKVMFYAETALILIVLAVAAYMHYAR